MNEPRVITWPMLLSDGRTLLFNDGGGRTATVAMATRPEADAPFGAPAPVTVGGKPLLGRSLHYVSATKELFFARPGANKTWDLCVVRPLALPTTLADLPRDDEGFYRLVPDDDLGAWRNAEGGPPGAGWTVKDGVLTLDPGAGTLWTRRQFDDFILALQFLGQGNSGVFFRTADPANPAQTGLEVQIIPPRKDRKPSKQSCGALYGLVAPAADVARAGAWNRMVLTVADRNVRVELNGRVILATKLPQRLKVADGPGYIGLQDHGDKVQFRNIRLKPLGD